MNDAVLQKAKSQLEALGKVLPARGRVLIIPHDYPDPDAFASAAALHLLLLKRFHLQGQIVFTGIVSRAENREMMKHCRYRWRLLQQLRPSAHKVPSLFVDTHPAAANVSVPSFAKPVAVLDHHSTNLKARAGEPLFSDIRRGAGATATILYEYLTAAEIAIPRWLAAIMVYAIATETLDLSRNCTQDDLDAYAALLVRANMRVVGKIRHAALPRSYYVQLQDALKSTFVYGRVAWAHLNDVQQPEIVPEVADLLCRMERVSWSFCTGYRDGNLILSLRSSQKGSHCGILLKGVLRKFGGTGGGHDWMAAGLVQAEKLDAVRREELREALVKALVSRIEKREVQPESLEAVEKSLVQPQP